MGKEKGDLYVEAEPKTKSSKRNIALPLFAIEALLEHRIRQDEMRKRAGDAWVDHNYVFCDERGKHLNPGHDALVQLKLLLKKAGLPEIRFHDLRHSMASLMFLNGVHPKVVQEILGHSEISMTMDIYSLMMPTMQKDAMSRFDRSFNKKKPKDVKEESGELGDEEEL